jgi:hypothetical protein
VIDLLGAFHEYNSRFGSTVTIQETMPEKMTIGKKKSNPPEADGIGVEECLSRARLI